MLARTAIKGIDLYGRYLMATDKHDQVMKQVRTGTSAEVQVWGKARNRMACDDVSSATQPDS